MNRSTLIITAILALISLGGGFALGKLSGGAPKNASSGAPDGKRILYWKAPMDPNFRSDKPGKSPMGMDLVPVYAGEEDGGDSQNLVRINPVVQQNIGVRTAKVERTTLARVIETVGFIRADDDLTATVDVRTQGWIEKLYVKTPGDAVRKGQPLFDLYSRPLVSAQEEYLQAVRIGRKALIEAARSRLAALGMSAAQIAAVRKAGKPRRLIRVYAPQDGVVTMLGVGEGAFVKPGRQIMMLADLSRVWVLAEVFENQAHWVKTGQGAVMTLEALPGRQWAGTVDYVYPTVNASARTVQVRLRFDNPDGVLKPDMYAKVRINSEPHVGVLAIDREALIQTGEGDHVILALGDGRFRPAHVTAGMDSGAKVEILDGLDEGEAVVVSGQFLIDSEASFRGTALRMTAPGEEIVSEASGMGVVEEIMPKMGMVTLQHQPIPELGWPAMTMAFVTGPEKLKGLKVGDSVHFTVREKANADGDFVITAIRKMNMNKESGQ